jgi:hypothetical protein
MAEAGEETYRDNPEVRHEKSDVSTAAILRFGLGLGGVLIGTALLLTGLFTYFNARESRLGRVAGRPPATEELPPEPRLEVSPRASLAELRATEEKILKSYSWVDKRGNVVRIPIERAMELIAERGLPARKETKERSAISSDPTGVQKLKADR